MLPVKCVLYYLRLLREIRRILFYRLLNIIEC